LFVPSAQLTNQAQPGDVHAITSSQCRMRRGDFISCSMIVQFASETLNRSHIQRFSPMESPSLAAVAAVLCA
ncbi:MAG: hypothetical protein ACKO7B_04230, partial [Flavobacteriales bacterium]